MITVKNVFYTTKEKEKTAENGDQTDSIRTEVQRVIDQVSRCASNEMT